MENEAMMDQVDSEIRLSFSLSRRDVLIYNLYFNRSLVFLTIILFLLLPISIIVAVKNPVGDIGVFYMWLAIGVGLAFIISFSSLLAIFIQVYYVKNDTVEKSMELRNYIINSAGIAIYTDNSRFVRSWKDMLKIIKTRNGYYLKTSDKAAVIIPFHVIDSESKRQSLQRIIAANKTSR
ncbi:MAG: YcxB family protein [candidate division Zixibacteria bacterium]|jgi:hypothetical protein|nr:YcxB family protein [candidate division Zixibacteria bacterium]